MKTNNLKLILITTLVLSNFFNGLSFPKAVSPTSPSPTATNSANPEDPEVAKSIKDRIQQAVEKNLGITNSNEPSGLVGKIDSVTNQSISLSINGSVVQITVDESTEIVDEDEDEISIEDLAIDSGALVIGSEDSSGLFNAVKIISIEEIPQPSSKVTLIGTISNINTRQSSLNILTNTSEDVFIELNRNSNLFEGFLDEELALADLNIDDKVILIYETNEDDENILIHLNRLTPATLEEESEEIDE